MYWLYLLAISIIFKHISQFLSHANTVFPGKLVLKLVCSMLPSSLAVYIACESPSLSKDQVMKMSITSLKIVIRAWYQREMTIQYNQFVIFFPIFFSHAWLNWRWYVLMIIFQWLYNLIFFSNIISYKINNSKSK